MTRQSKSNGQAEAWAGVAVSNMLAAMPSVAEAAMTIRERVVMAMIPFVYTGTGI